jgi:hypothetical protein
MKKRIKVVFAYTPRERKHTFFICRGFWCDRCKMRFECFTSKEILEFRCYEHWGTPSNFVLDEYNHDTVATWVSLKLFGFDSCSIVIDDEWYAKEVLEIK